MWSWYLVGLFFYGACLISLVLLFKHDPSLGTRARALDMVIVLMILNPIWNVAFFRFQAFGMSFAIFILITVLSLITVYMLYWVDGEAAAPFIPYLLYLPYGGAWSYVVWRMNRAGTGVH